MATFFLVIIYLAFISLGLPDSLLGSAWPVMQLDLGAPFSAAGIISMVITGGTIVSSLNSARLLHKFGTAVITFVSALFTAVALLGFALAPSLVWLFLLAIPLGLGAGAIDSGLNAYVAMHYKAHHMSFLHCFWGVGATLGPVILAQFMGGTSSWRGGYFAIAMIQFVLVVILFFTLPLWKGQGGEPMQSAEDEPTVHASNLSLMRIKGVPFALLAFLFYCGAELTMGLWGSSFLVSAKGLLPADAARWVSMYYAGITMGRLITGLVTMRLSSKTLIRTGLVVALVGAALLLLPLDPLFSLAGFVLIGLGFAPAFPCMLHETPVRFGKTNAQAVMGLQMAFAYIGNTVLPPAIGWVISSMGINLFPPLVIICLFFTLVGSECINLMMKKRAQAGTSAD